MLEHRQCWVVGCLAPPIFYMESLWHWWEAHCFYCLHCHKTTKKIHSATVHWWVSPFFLLNHKSGEVAVALACVSTLQCSVQRCFVRQLLLCQCCRFQIYFTTAVASPSSTKTSGSRKEAWTQLWWCLPLHCHYRLERKKSSCSKGDTSSRFSRTPEAVLNLSLLLW